MNKKFLDLDESFSDSYHQKTIKVARNSPTCNFRITNPMTYFVPFVVQKISSKPCTIFCPQITDVIKKIESNTQRDLNVIFYEISEYGYFFVLKCFLRKKSC